MCIFFPRCLWMLTDATIGVDQHSHTHTPSLSVSPLPCFLSPPFLTLYKLVLRLCVYQLKYRFHRIWLSKKLTFLHTIVISDVLTTHQ
jgi:hypothetical protein